MLKTIADIINQSVTWLLSTQNADGGLPYDDSGNSSGTWNTAGVLWAISNVPFDNNAINYEAIRNAYLFLVKSFNKDGLIPFSKKGDSGCIDATAQYILSVTNFLERGSKLERLLKPTISRATNALLTYSTDDYWSVTPNGEISMFSTALVIMALQKALQFSSDNDATKKKICKTINNGLTHLINNQKKMVDGVDSILFHHNRVLQQWSCMRYLFTDASTSRQ